MDPTTTEQPTITTDPTNDDQALIHFPEFGLLDTQAWSVDVGIPVAALPGLRDAITRHLVATGAEAAPRPPIPGHTYEGPGACRADLFGRVCGGRRDDHQLISEGD